MSNVITVTSPLGYIVSCTQSQWNDHILVNHPNMKGKEKIVANAVANPQWVYQSNEFPSRDVYFASSGHTNEKLRLAKVIVETNTCQDATIVSAWMQASITGNINPEEIRYVNPKLR